MAGKPIQFNLQFNANTQAAKAAMKDLQNQLSNLIVSSNSNQQLGLTTQLRNAQQSAMDLKIALNNATNVDTGKLNLNKFQSELRRSGQTLDSLARNMKALGPEGVQAFAQVARAVAQADTKIFSLQGGMKKLATTFMNTARWQVTASIIQGITSSISETVNYAKELDTSLNNIRIVTGKSADQMARFAKEANAMAKELSTTTTKYSDASLIYYQQGLNDKAVKERTDVTVKLANVVGENAQAVSEWMTAIWNNFDDGSESLEYYADVLAKLGAATASSADEIAGGLEKFAAVADTIGLSYEYAASMLATITAETRQSEDVVGTALKTILSRMEQLEQGDTLDDGTTLGKYSLALQKIGVDIKDASGELKDMDIILQQTGNRWDTLARDQQIALAQSVAGIRQYTQFMALMDNWDVMENNLELTEKANGALNEQHRIYEESVQAAEQRMTAAGEKIKATLFGGDDLKGLYDFGAGALEVVAELMEGFGGLRTILLMVATALTKVYQPQIASFASQFATNVVNTTKSLKNLFTGKGMNANQEYKANFVGVAANMAASQDTGSTESHFLKENLKIQEKMLQHSNTMTANEKQRAEWLLQQLQVQQKLLIEGEKEIQNARELALASEQNLTDNYGVSEQTARTLGAQTERFGKMKGAGALALEYAKQGSGLDLKQGDRQQIADKTANMLQQTANAGAAMGIDDAVWEQQKAEIDSITQDLAEYGETGKKNIDDIITRIDTLNQKLLELGQEKVTEASTAVAEEAAQAAVPGFEAEANKLNIHTNTGLEKTSAALNSVDEKSFSKENQEQLKTFKERAKALQNEKKLLDQQKQSINGSKKKQEEYNKALNAHKAKVRELNKDLSKFSNTTKKSAKENSKFADSMDDVDKNINNVSENSTKAAEGAVAYEEGMDGLNGEMETFNEGLDGAKFKSYSDLFASGLAGLSQYAMGLSMLTSSFEQLGKSIAGGSTGLTDWISNLSSMLMGIMMVIPGMKQMNESIGQMILKRFSNAVATKAEEAAQKSKINTDKQESQEEGKVVQKKKVSIITKIFNAFAGIAEDAGQGIPGWVQAIASLAMVAPIALMVGASVVSFGSGMAQQQKEEKQEAVSKGAETVEAINENQKLSESINDLTEDYKRLREAEESTSDVLKEMDEKIPELIKSYKELGKTIGTPIDTSRLEQAYETFKQTGSLQDFEYEKQKMDESVAARKKTTLSATISNASDLVMDAVREGDGYKSGNSFVLSVGNAVSDDTSSKDLEENQIGNSYLAKHLGDYYQGSGISQGTLKFDMTNEAQILDVYDKMIAARDAMKADLGDSAEDVKAYKQLNAQIEEMSENIEDLRTAQNEKFELELDEALNGSLADDITKAYKVTAENYAKLQPEIIKHLVQTQQWTEAQAKSFLRATEAFGKYEDELAVFGTDSMRYTQIAERMGEDSLTAIKNWYASLPDSDKTLFLGIDFSIASSLEDAKQQLEEIKQKAADAAILEEVAALEIDEAVFDSYVENFAQVNGELDKNTTLTKQIALNNLKLTKGLETLGKNWQKNYNIIALGNKGTLEYAEALGELKKGLEETFGFQPSSSFIERHLREIGDLINGDISKLKELQDQLAEEYILTMEFKTAINDKWSGTVNDAQAELRKLMDSLDTSIQVGEGSELSGDFLNSVQDMLDAGVIAEQDLEGLFRAKGYELDISGWKEIDGPKKTITQTTYKNGVSQGTTVIEESEKIQVPIINGEEPEGGNVTIAAGHSEISVAKYSKSATPTGLSTTSADKAKREWTNNVRNLNDEIDHYYEIDNVIEHLADTMDELSKAKERAFGADKIAYLKAEEKILTAEIAAQDKLIKKAQTRIDIDKKNLKNQFGAKVDDTTGTITNYTAIQTGYLQKLANISDTSSDEYKKLEEEYELFKDYAQKYEDDWNKRQEARQTKTEKEMEQYANKLEQIDYKIEINVELNEREFENIQRQIENLEDKEYQVGERIKLRTQAFNQQYDNVGYYENGIRQTLEAAGASGNQIKNYIAGNAIDISNLNLDNTTIEQLTEYTDGLTEAYEAMKTLREEVENEVIETFDHWHTELEDHGEAFEHATTLLNNYKNITDLIGKDRLGLDNSLLKDINDAANQAALGGFKNNVAIMNYTKSALSEAEQALAQAKTEDDQNYWKERISDLTKQLRTDTEAVADSWSSYLEQITNSFQENIEHVLDTFDDAIAGSQHKSLAALQEAFDKEREITDLYVEDYEKIYELNKLNRNINKSLDTTDNIKAQKALRELQAEINEYQKDGREMSKYELEHLQKKYDLRVAEIALEEAQNAKSVVTLRRDSEGNFGYVYTANQADIDTAQQGYEDKLYAMQSHNDNYLEQLQSDVITNRQAMIEELRNLDITDYANAEQYYAARDQIIEHYKEKENFYLNEIQTVLTNNKTLYNDDWLAYAEKTGYKISESEKWEDDFSETVYAMQTGYGSIEEAASGLNSAIGSIDNPDSLLGGMHDAYSTWETEYDEIMSLAEQALGDFGETNNSTLGPDGTAQNDVGSFANFVLQAMYGEGGTKEKPTGGVVKGIRDASNETVELEKTSKKQFSQTVQNALNFQTQISPKLQAVKSKVDAINNSLNTLIGKKTQTVSVSTNKNVDTTYTKLQQINAELKKITNKDITITATYKTVGTPPSTPDTENPNLNPGDEVDQSKTVSKVKDVVGGTTRKYVKIGNKWYVGAHTVDNWSKVGSSVTENSKVTLKATAAYISDENMTYLENALKDHVTGKDADKSAEIVHGGKGSTLDLPFYYGTIGQNAYTYQAPTDNFANVQVTDIFPYNGILYAHVQDEGSQDAGFKTGPMAKLNSAKTAWMPFKYLDFDNNDLADYPMFDTGGYTGEWGPEGRLAMLHQKEIVLNAHDTANLLTAVDIVRSMADKLEMNASLASQGIAGLTASIAPYRGGDTLEQNVTIHAEFPNATNHNEIEEAFGNLVNLASQYANRK